MLIKYDYLEYIDYLDHLEYLDKVIKMIKITMDHRGGKMIILKNGHD